MRTLILVCVVALLVCIGVAYAVGLVAVTADHSDGRCVVSLIVNTAMRRHNASGADNAPHHDLADDRLQEVNDSLQELKGKVTAVRTHKNELVVSESFKNWTFQLASGGSVYINGRESKLGELQEGDNATVTFDRQGERLLASVIRCTRE